MLEELQLIQAMRNQDSIRKQLLSYKEKHNLKYQDLSRIIGVNYLTIHRFLTADIEMRERTLVRVLEFLEKIKNPSKRVASKE